jgi:outer membrane murein-binding lipoprotein Lpp
MLAFYHRHPDRCLCLDARALFSNPSAAVDLCATTWKLPLEKDRISTPTSLLPDPLAWFLAQQMVTGHDEEAASLWQEVEATVHPLEGEALMDQPGSKAILARYSDLCEHSGKLVKLEADQSKLQEENNKILSQLHHAQEGLENTCRANQQLETEQQKIIQDNDALNKDKATLTQRINELDAKTKQLEGKIKDSEEENELLLLQLHQVQEELETTFLKNQKLDDTSNRLEKEKAALEKRINELDAKTKQLESEKQKLVQDNGALSKDKATLTQRITGLEARTKELETHNQQQKKEIETGGRHVQKIEELENRLRDTSDENELLLLQLHQVQEELEKYFLGNQKTQQQLDEIESRWQRLQQRYPAYCDYTDLSIEEHDKTLRWIFNEYLGGGRKIDRLCVDLNLKRNVAGLTLSRENIHDSSPLVYWPKLHQDATSLDLAPNALTREQALALVHTYSQIATSDWLWLQDLGAAMIDHLESDHPALDHIDESLREQFIQGLDLHQEKLESLPPVLRCDAVHLVQEHSANGYEHIWLRLENPHFTNSQCSDFEFRLACVNDSGAGHDLGNHPRLEFPDQGGDTLLVNWFMESENQFGANLELRFALPDIMDTDLWARLDQKDAALISSLLEQLPFFLDREKDALAGLRRPTKQWIDLARKMAAIHRRWTEHAANAKETA